MQRLLLLLFCTLLAPALSAQSAMDSLTYVHYNVLMYGNSDCGALATRNNRLRPVLAYLRPDILTLNEMSSNVAAINNFEQNALNFNPLMERASSSNTAGSDIINVLFYNSAKLGYLGSEALTGLVRDIDIHRLYHKNATQAGDTLDFYCLVAHFKSSQGASNEAQRAEAAALVADWLIQHPQVTRYVFSGDFNLYSSSEPAWQTLVTQSGLFEDPMGQADGWDGPVFAAIHTQSPAPSSVACAVTGGMDNRFDFILTSPDVYSGAGHLHYVPDTYRAVGNDGFSYNTSLQCSLNSSVPPVVCEALRLASDHLPVVLSLSVESSNSTASEAAALAPFALLGNVVRDQLVIQNQRPDGKIWHWQMLNLFGAVVAAGDVEAGQKNIATHSLSSGSYVLQVRNAAGVTQVFRWVKM